ncbi:MAG: hypothetical protein LBN00_12125 [Oscillospiraceae bacterium]|jgi:nitrogenase molybdenum-iron protein beta chain|nr:hypothetical protein [Oscillospiraceae bacterium]
MATFVERPRSACALSGALVTVTSLPGVVPIVHAASGCAGNLSGVAAFGGGNYGSGNCGAGTIPTSSITETEIVFGGAERLREEIQSTFELMDAELYVVATGCMTEMIGDDTGGVVNEFSGDYPIIAISTPSFKGDSYAGYEIALDGIFNRFLPRGDAKKDAKLVNIFGVIPAYDPFFRGDLEELARLIGRLGLRANTFFTPDQTFDNIRSAPNAALNIVFSRAYGIGFAERFEERHGTPFWVTDLPIGPEATDAFLTELAARAGVAPAIASTAIESENALYYGYFERTVDAFADGNMKYFSVTVTNSNYALPLARFAYRELGWVLLDSYITDQLDDIQREAVTQAFAATGILAPPTFQTDTSLIAKSVTERGPRNRGERYFDDITPLFILGSSLEKQTAAKRGAGQLSVSFPAFNRMIVDRGYAGYRGGLHLFEDIVGSLVVSKG